MPATGQSCRCCPEPSETSTGISSCSPWTRGNEGRNPHRASSVLFPLLGLRRWGRQCRGISMPLIAGGEHYTNIFKPILTQASF